MTYFLADSDLDSLVKQVMSAAHDPCDLERETKVRLTLHGFGLAPESCRETIEADERADRAFDAAKAMRASASNMTEGLTAARQLFDRPVATGTHEISENITLTVN